MEPDPRDQLFAAVRAAFATRGLLRQAIRIREGGRAYSLRCDDECFTVYRINDKPFLPPGEPGWMVCRLEGGACFSLDPEGDTCGLPPDPAGLEAARAWAELALKHLVDRGD
ncbi:MAG: hypothetical protein LDL07_03520 [Desulfarculus sp.]|nr:hypothetical protein [Desulfarculus sp.]